MPKQRWVEVSRTDTGEKFDAPLPGADALRWKGGYALVGQIAYDEIAVARWPLTDYRVLIYLMSILDYENWVCIDKKRAAQRLGVTPQLVYSSVARLVRAGALHKVNEPGKCEYRLDPYLGWKGTAPQRDAAIRHLNAVKVT